ncbi:MAG TPA: glucosyl-3-phosphoglycerate synthase [Anaerolineales bacterium]|jgi:glucosyl-3-phosphoglycerate synthase|nr:glucosyl-3-phosphoglycerate synthase [Anaerolineales bacterium]
MDTRPIKERGTSQAQAPLPIKVLLPLSSLDETRIMLPLAEMIIAARHGLLVILHVISVPEGEPLSEAARAASKYREDLGKMLSDQLSITAQVKTLVRPETEIWGGIWDVVELEDIDLLLLGWSDNLIPETAGRELKDPRLVLPPCDVVAVRPAEDIIGEGGWGTIERILLPMRGGPYAGMALRVANTLAQATDATITLLHATDQAPREAEEQLLNAYGPVLRGLERVKRSMTVVNPVSDAIIEEAPEHQVVVVGAPTIQTHPGEWSGPLIDAIIAKTNTTLIMVKKRQEATQKPAAVPEELLEQPPEPAEIAKYAERPVAVVVDEWFAENTFQSREFADLERLIALKAAQGVTISLGLPALNEAETVGNVIQTIKSVLMEEVPLLDEIVLIDSGSIDYTREIASQLGVPVYIHQEILPQHGSYEGKGEALWKSLYVLRGDLVAWVDTDIKNIHPRFVYGIIGPLLRDPRIQYVKGFYRRPLREGDKLVAGGGGRVTELTARPFINLFFPELSGLIQPLSGEYAGRRSALERVPFFTGYGVETGLLIDILDEYGLHGIAQVDLLERIHHNQPLPSLSKMSFAIMQVVFSRLEKRHQIRLLEDANLTMNLVRYGPRRYFLETEEIRERERPPMVSIREYRKGRGLPRFRGRDGNSSQA